jgi:hypothetical protein
LLHEDFVLGVLRILRHRFKDIGFWPVEEKGNGKSKGEGNCAVVGVEEGVKM